MEATAVNIDNELLKLDRKPREVRIENPIQVMVIELHRTQGRIAPIEILASFGGESECVMEHKGYPTMVCREKLRKMI